MSSRASRRRAAQRSAARNSSLPLWMFVAVLLVAVAIIYWMLNPAQQAVTISPQQAYQKYLQGGFLLDVRTQEEWKEFHVPGTTWIPLDELPDRITELPRDQEIIVICRSGNRSQKGRDVLLDAGFENVSSMSGGLTEWQALGYPLE